MPVTREKETTNEAEQQAARITCDALCSLANAPTPRKTLETFEVSVNLPVPPMPLHGFHSQATASLAATSPSALTLSPLESETSGSSSCIKVSRTKVKACPKQHQLPLFLSKTYHMIDKCDPAVATWSASGDNFVVKNVEKFASTVLPMYFKHSNFSSFARQLNFYGFRKLRSDPILTNDVDPQTSTYIRFYHEKFQKDRPELLHSIKRATKSDQQSKDDVDELKSQVFKLNKCVLEMSAQMERKICEMNVEYNRRISCMTVEYEKLAGLVSQLLQQKDAQNPAHISLPQSSHHLNHIHYPPLPPVVETTTANTSSATTSVSTDNSGGFTLISDSSGSSSTAKSTTSPSMAIAESSGKQQQKTQSLSKVVASNYVGIASATGAVAPSPSISSMSTIVHGTRTAGKRTASKTLISADSETPKVIKPRISYN